jgi:hypothetical protein
MTKMDKLKKLLQRKQGATSMDIIAAIGTVSPHSRLSNLKSQGYTILKKPVKGTNYNRYFIVKGTK